MALGADTWQDLVRRVLGRYSFPDISPSSRLHSHIFPAADGLSPLSECVLSFQPCLGPHMGLGFPGDGTWPLIPFLFLTQIYGYDELQMLQSRLPMVSGMWWGAGRLQSFTGLSSLDPHYHSAGKATCI